MDTTNNLGIVAHGEEEHRPPGLRLGTVQYDRSAKRYLDHG
jgi:hypothetical protein